MHHLTRNIGQTKITTILVESQTFMIEPHQVKHGGMEIVDTDPVISCFEPYFIRTAVMVTTFDTPTGKPECKGVRVVVATGIVLALIVVRHQLSSRGQKTAQQ